MTDVQASSFTAIPNDERLQSVALILSPRHDSGSPDVLQIQAAAVD